MGLFNKKVYILNREVNSYDDGSELQPQEVYTNYRKAVKAKKEWFDMVKDMLDDAGIEYEVGVDEIFAGEDSWNAWVETCDVDRDLFNLLK